MRVSTKNSNGEQFIVEIYCIKHHLHILTYSDQKWLPLLI